MNGKYIQIKKSQAYIVTIEVNGYKSMRVPLADKGQ